jgi:hypothetical protein
MLFNVSMRYHALAIVCQAGASVTRVGRQRLLTITTMLSIDDVEHSRSIQSATKLSSH